MLVEFEAKALAMRVQLRSDTKANWDNYENVPALIRGEIGIELDTNKIKIGDGVTPWPALTYANVTPEEVEPLIDAIYGTEVTDGILTRLDDIEDKVRDIIISGGNLGINNIELCDGALCSIVTKSDGTKHAVIPIATDTGYGLVKSNPLDNGISVGPTGFMTVNNLSIDKVFIPNDTSLIICCGGSNIPETTDSITILPALI